MFKTTIGIDGMKCEKCEAKIKNLLKSNFKVSSVIASHTEGNAVVESKAKLNEEMLKSLIGDTGFSVTEITIEENAGKRKFFLKRLFLFLFFDYPLK